MPAAPFVGAVTTRPPAAFSSLTASAYSVTHSIARNGSWLSSVDSSVLSRGPARRRTWSPPGSVPVAWMPRFTHSCITDQMCSSPERISSSLRRVSSLASITSLMLSPVTRVRRSNSSTVLNGCGTARALSSAEMCECSISSWSRTNPPPTE